VRVKAYDQPKTIANAPQKQQIQQQPQNANSPNNTNAANMQSQFAVVDSNVPDGQEEEEGFEIGISLMPDPVMEPPAFQKIWIALPVG
jgi:hypothetical protein